MGARKLGFTGVYIIFLIFARKHKIVVLVNEYPQSMFRAEIWKYQSFFIWIFLYLGGKIIFE